MKRSFEEVTPSVIDGVPSSSVKKVPLEGDGDVSLVDLFQMFEIVLFLTIHVFQSL